MSERRSFWLLIVILLAQLIALASQVGSASGSRLESWLLRAASPVGRLVDATGDRVQGAASRFAGQQRLRQENQDLRAEVEELRRKVMELAPVEREYERLARAVGYAQVERPPLLVADVVFMDRGSRVETMVVYAGSRRLAVDQPVVSATGLIGRIALLAGPYAKVQLVTDRTSSVGAMIDRSRRQGLVRGGEHEMLELEKVPATESVEVGDLVITSGIDGVYPRGIAIGTVAEVAPGDELFQRIRLRPAVDFDRLDQVYVIGHDPLPAALRRTVSTDGER